MRSRTNGAAAGVEVIGIAIDFREDVLKYLEKMPINYPVLIGEQDGIGGRAGFRHGEHRPAVHRVHRPAGADRAIHVGELHDDAGGVILSA